jgi:CheY-like chemotaxis protein
MLMLNNEYKVLVGDYEAPIVYLVQNSLPMQNFSLTHCRSAEEVRDYVNNEKYDLIVLRNSIPEERPKEEEFKPGFNEGLNLALEIREHLINKDSLIYLLSGNIISIENSAKKAGINGLIQLPAEIADFKKAFMLIQ